MAEREGYFAKALESLATAEDDFAKGRFNSAARNAYYALLQAAVAALIHEGEKPSGPRWGHEFIHSRFSGLLVYRRRIYPSEFRSSLIESLTIRSRADYSPNMVSRREALQILRRARGLIALVGERIEWQR